MEEEAVTNRPQANSISIARSGRPIRQAPQHATRPRQSRRRLPGRVACVVCNQRLRRLTSITFNSSTASAAPHPSHAIPFPSSADSPTFSHVACDVLNPVRSRHRPAFSRVAFDAPQARQKPPAIKYGPRDCEAEAKAVSLAICRTPLLGKGIHACPPLSYHKPIEFENTAASLASSDDRMPPN